MKITDSEPDYEKMYKILFNEITDSILLLQKIQQETENIFIKTTEVQTQ